MYSILTSLKLPAFRVRAVSLIVRTVLRVKLLIAFSLLYCSVNIILFLLWHSKRLLQKIKNEAVKAFDCGISVNLLVASSRASFFSIFNYMAIKDHHLIVL